VAGVQVSTDLFSCPFDAFLQDERLKVAVNTYGREWLKVAEHVGGGATNMQCYQRWTKYIDPALSNALGKGPWSAKEVSRMKNELRLCDLLDTCNL
jgi:hypothetical protein